MAGEGTTVIRPTPPATPKRGYTSGKMIAAKVQMLDDTLTIFQVQPKALGRVLFEQLCRQLNLLEADYFGLEYQDAGGSRYWLDLEKHMNRQLGLPTDPVFRFGVKFYTPDPGQLEEEFTRYLFCLQIKRDLAQGILRVNDNTAAVLASYIVQAESGDYVAEDYPDHSYLSGYKFVPDQTPELERRIMENHKKLVGQSPAEADLNLLETARRCEFYGIKMTPSRDQEGIPLNLAITHTGLHIFQNWTRINMFNWGKIRKLSFKRKRFLLKLHPDTQGLYKNMVEFHFDGRNESKNFWKKCVEHHGFFRCTASKKSHRQKPRVISRGSSFRYSGRTQVEVMEFVRENYIKRQSFQRSQSFRQSTGPRHGHHMTAGSVGTSLSAQPLLPISTEALLGTSTPKGLGRLSGGVGGENHIDAGDYDMETPSLATSRAETLSQQTSVTSSPQRMTDRITDDECSSSPRRSHPGSSVPPGQDEIIAEDDRNGIVSSPVGPRLIGLPMPSPVQMPVTSVEPVNKEILQSDQEPEVRRKRFPTDKAYFIAKEILMTERTYKKDLEVIVLWFQEEICKAGGPLGDGVWHLLFHLLDPIYEFHCALLREVEHRLATWEGRGNAHLKGDYQRVGDIFLNNMNKIIELYRGYLTHHLEIIEGMERAYEEGGMFQNLLQSFEAQKVAYLPLNAFLLKPLHRLIHYKLILQRLVSHYTEDHEDLSTCEGALRALNPLAHDIERSLSMSEQKVKLIELGRDLIGLPPPPSPEGGTPQRQFILEGCLQKLSRDGYHQRMFFLFSDVLVYANRTTVPFLGFRVHGSLPLAGMMLEEAGDPQVSPSPHSFTIYSKNRAMMVAGSSEAEKKKWVEAIRDAVSCCVVEPPLLGLSPPSHLNHLSLKSASSSEEVSPSDSESRRGGKGSGNVGPPGPGHHPPRNNTTVHVCWHRNRSMSIAELHASQSSQLSGYLLRKFKNHSGWQKLWVVFTHLCLFFYKTCQDDFPLASLPMLGYIITIPSPGDAINKDYVFKLQFKNHVYFFRAESEYTFSRWMEVIRGATGTAN